MSPSRPARPGSRSPRSPWWCWTAGAWRPTAPATRSRRRAPRSSTSSGARATRAPPSPPPGRDVGLPPGQMGNSEVGHLNLGAGAVVKQDLARIDDAIADGSFFENPALRGACAAARDSRAWPPARDRAGLRRRRPLGLGAHRGGDRAGRRRGRHRPRPARAHRRPRHPAAPRAPATSRRSSAGCGRPAGSARSAAATGEWTATAAGTGPSAPTTRSSTPEGRGPRRRWGRSRASYEREITDEFIEPTVIGDYDGAAADEPVIFINFRPDRARQLTMALGEPDFDEFDRGGGAGVRGDDDDRVPRTAGPTRSPSRRRCPRRRSPR